MRLPWVSGYFGEVQYPILILLTVRIGGYTESLRVSFNAPFQGG